MKVQVNRAFKSFFCLQKINKKADSLDMKIFFKPQYKCAGRPQSLILKSTPLFLLPFLFRRISLPPGQDQLNGKRTWCRLPPQSFRINPKDISFYISISSLNFLSHLYIPPLLQVCGVQVAEKYFCESENLIQTFLLMTSGKTFSQVFIIPRQSEITRPSTPPFSSPPVSVFLQKIVPQQKGEGRNYVFCQVIQSN